jgi:hypothetical protein
MKMQPKNMVSGREIAISRLFPGWNRLFAVFLTLPEVGSSAEFAACDTMLAATLVGP